MREALNSSFWEKLFTASQNWVITELPGIIILTLLITLILRITEFSIKKLKVTLSRRAHKSVNVDPLEAEKRINTLIGMIHKVIKVFIMTMFIIILLDKFGVDIGPILASAGILGLAVGFGAQELVRDFISGFFLLLEDQIRTGDVAIINGTGGLVEKIELRTITLRDFSGTVHIFQNGKINTLSNMTKEWSAIALEISVAYKENIQHVISLMTEVGAELQKDPAFSDKIIDPIEVAGLDRFDESAMVIKARIKTKPGQQWSVGREYRKNLKAKFDIHKIEIPYPHSKIIWDNNASLQ